MRRKTARHGASARPAAILAGAVCAALVATAALAATGRAGAAGTAATAPGTSPATAPGTAPAGGAGDVIAAIGAENHYADVIAQVGGRYVRVSALLSSPASDPHAFEASSAVARQVGEADLIVQNGLGYDAFMGSLEEAAPGHERTIIDVQRLLGLPDDTPNPHLWYSPGTMPRVADAVATALARLAPAHAAYFRANAAAFTGSLGAWKQALAGSAAATPGVPVATTEPVADYLLQAAGAVNLTPWAFQADLMNGTDPAPQDVAVERALLAGRQVRALVYNVQVTSSLTESLITLARQHGIPVVGVYETMPEPGYHYQSWMLAETAALRQAVEHQVSAEHL